MHYFVPSDEVGPVPTPEEQDALAQEFVELRVRLANMTKEQMDAAEAEMNRRWAIAIEEWRKGNLNG